jgi:hypothetical protein
MSAAIVFLLGTIAALAYLYRPAVRLLALHQEIASARYWRPIVARSKRRPRIVLRRS